MRTVFLPLASLLIGCAIPDGEPDLPPLTWQGDRVRFGTSLVSNLCGGTLLDLDANLAFIEHELGLEPEGTIDVVCAGR